MILDNSTYHCSPLELVYRRCRVRNQKDILPCQSATLCQSGKTPSEREVPSERDADAADYEAGHSDAEFNEAAYPLAAGLHADCSCLK